MGSGGVEVKIRWTNQFVAFDDGLNNWNGLQHAGHLRRYHLEVKEEHER
jgi:hypothetical protein